MVTRARGRSIWIVAGEAFGRVVVQAVMPARGNAGVNAGRY